MKLFTILLAIGVSAAVIAQSRYTIKDLGHPELDTTEIHAINNQEMIVFNEFPGGGSRPFKWFDGQLTYLQGYQAPNNSQLLVRDVNDANTAVGQAPVADQITHAIRWVGTVPEDLGAGDSSTSVAINSSGQIVGNSDSGPFLWEAGNLTFLQSQWQLGLNSISSTGVIVGSARVDGVYRPMKWENGQTSLLETTGRPGWAVSTNSLGEIVGNFTGEGGRVNAFYFHNGQLALLPLGSGFAWAAVSSINENGEIIGDAFDQYNRRHPVIWANREIYKLEDLVDNLTGWTLAHLADVNDLGQITGIAQRVGYSPSQGFILTPVPEPTTIGILGLGLALIARRRR